MHEGIEPGRRQRRTLWQLLSTQIQ